MTLRWYALRSKPNKEEALWREAAARGCDVFYPQIRVQPKNPRARKIRPYFPGYLFVQLDLHQSGYSTLRLRSGQAFAWMPHSRGLVSFGAEPASVPDGLIHAIRRRVEEINAADGEVLESLRHGEPVIIQDGPFVGYEAIFDARLPGSERVRVLLKLLQNRQVPVDLPAGQIQRIKRR